jgi:hypothetical protein
MTTLYGLIRGKSPEFFDGNAQAFSGLHFHLDDEVFEFYAAAKMKDNPMWVSVTKLMQQGIAPFTIELLNNPETKDSLESYIDRLSAITNIGDIELQGRPCSGTRLRLVASGARRDEEAVGEVAQRWLRLSARMADAQHQRRVHRSC